MAQFGAFLHIRYAPQGRKAIAGLTLGQKSVTNGRWNVRTPVGMQQARSLLIVVDVVVGAVQISA